MQSASPSLLTADRLRHRYLLALSIIAALTIVSQAMIQYFIADQEHDSRIVNIAGRQRMLSQKITKISLLIADAGSARTAAPLRSQLADALALWTASHRGLQQGDAALGLPGRNSREIERLFAHIEPNFRAMAKSADALLVTGASPPPREHLQTLLANEGDFLKGMDAIVFRYDEESKNKIVFAKWFEISLMIVTLLVLALEARLIFAPAERRIRRDMLELQGRCEDLDRLFAASPQALALVDAESMQVIRLNRQAQLLLRIDAEPLAEFPLRDVFAADHARNRQCLESLGAQRDIDGHEALLIDAAQTPIHALISARRIRLHDRAAHVIGIADITELRKAADGLLHQAAFDGMTGLFNRRTGLATLDQMLGESRRTGTPLSIGVADIDNLRDTNDKQGHEVGDWLIRTAAALLMESVRNGGCVARLDGDEFLLVLPDCPPQEAKKLGESIRAKAGKAIAGTGHPVQVEIRLSCGFASFDAGRHDSAQMLLREANANLHQEKRRKRDYGACV